MGLATQTEAAAMGSFGGSSWRQRTNSSIHRVKESVFLTAKTSAMVCWLFIGSSVFAAAFALLGGQEIINAWVLSLNMTPTQFMLMAQVIIFLLGWPLESTEIIVIFMPIFIRCWGTSTSMLFFGLLVALNLQTAFLSPPVAMAAFYLKGVAPPHVTLNQIFIGMMPFMVIQCLGDLFSLPLPRRSVCGCRRWCTMDDAGPRAAVWSGFFIFPGGGVNPDSSLHLNQEEKDAALFTLAGAVAGNFILWSLITVVAHDQMVTFCLAIAVGLSHDRHHGGLRGRRRIMVSRANSVGRSITI